MFGAVVVWVWLLGIVVAMFVMPRRVGLNRFAWAVAFAHPPSRRNGIPWAILSYLKALVWPIVLGYWLVQDRPPSRVLFGAEAAEILYGDPDRAMPGFVTKWTRTST
jgi:hypothetical protein